MIVFVIFWVPAGPDLSAASGNFITQHPCQQTRSSHAR